jgi:hypothetical protein
MDADTDRRFEEIRLEIHRLNERLSETERSVAELFSQLARIRDRLGFDTVVEATRGSSRLAASWPGGGADRSVGSLPVAWVAGRR